MTDLSQAFPTRPVKVKRSGVWPGILAYLGALMLGAVAAFIAIWQAPGIVNDWRVSQDPVVVYDAEITDGECNTRQGVFVDCSAHVSYEVKAKPFEHDIELMFVDFSTGDYQVDVVRSEQYPQLAALSLGLDMLWNRIIVGTLFVLFLAAAAVGLLLNGLRADRQRRIARQGAVLQPVSVDITNISKVVGGKAIQFQYGINRKNRPLLTISRFKSKEEPFWLHPDTGQALAVLPQGSTVPFLLDQDLRRLDLTDTERAAILGPTPAAAV